MTTDRATTITALIAALAGIVKASGYLTDVVEVKRGVVDYTDFTALPGIAVWNMDESVQDYTNDEEISRLRFMVWGHVQCPAGNYTPLDNLATDLKKLLFAGWSKAELTFYAGRIRYWEADPGTVSFEIEVENEYERDNPAAT